MHHHYHVHLHLTILGVLEVWSVSRIVINGLAVSEVWTFLVRWLVASCPAVSRGQQSTECGHDGWPGRDQEIRSPIIANRWLSPSLHCIVPGMGTLVHVHTCLTQCECTMYSNVSPLSHTFDISHGNKDFLLNSNCKWDFCSCDCQGQVTLRIMDMNKYSWQQGRHNQ